MVQAVIMAAGKSTRTYPLTATRPKPLLKVANKPILQWHLEALQGLVDEVILIIGYKKEMLKEAFGESFGRLKITYVEQDEQLGTADALKVVEQYIKGKFMIFNGDDLYGKEDFKHCLSNSYCILAKDVEDPSRYGIIITKDDGLVDYLIEKPKKPVSCLANVGCYVFDEKVFRYLSKIKRSERGEYEMPDVVSEIAKDYKVSVHVVEDYWLPIAYPWDIIDANEFILNRIEKDKIDGAVEKGATVKGSVLIGKGTLIKSGVYIEGPVVIGKNCNIGPNCYIRPCTSIGDSCKVGNAVEIKNSVIGDGTSVGHLSYFGDSVIGENVNIGAGTITANLRHDGKDIVTVQSDNKVETRRRKLGAIIGDNVKTGINTMFYPGRKLYPEKITLPGEVVKGDII